MKGSKDSQVTVVGAGPVGLATALTLNKRGIPVTVVERDDRPGTHSYALALHASTADQLDRWGLLEPLRKNAVEVKGILFHDDKEPRYDLQLNAIPNHPSGLLVVGQDHLEETLVKPLEDAGIPIRWNHRVAGLEPGTEDVKIDLERLSEGMSGYAMARLEWQVDRELSTATPFVVGADGHFSMIRRKMGIAFPRIAPTQSFAVFEFKTDYAHENRARVIFGKEGTSVLWPLPGGYCRWGFEIDETAAEQYSRDKDRLYVQVGSQGYHALETDMLRRLLEERAPWFDGNIGNFRWRMIVRFEKRLAESFGNGRVWLAGDAGHLAAPIGMQSMNVGIREGCQLGEILAGVIGGQATSRKLEAYGLDRQREWRALMGLDSRMEPTDETDPFLKEHADKLLGCLPAAMDALPAFAKTMGMVLSGDKEA